MVLSKKDFNSFIATLSPIPSEKELRLCKRSYNQLTRNSLNYIHDLKHLSQLLQVPPKQLSRFILNKDSAYVSFKIPKRSMGYREINAPCKELKKVQRMILDLILYKMDPGDHAHGFIPGRSIYTNAIIHVKQELIFGIDIKDYFPSISFDCVHRLFRQYGFNHYISKDLAELVTYNDQLPQGSPTSPMIANLVSINLDNKLAEYCRKHGFNYSRYADDITISGSKIIPRYKTNIIKIIERNGFKINYKKIRILGRGSCQKVTGLVVNDKVSIGRKKKRRIRSILKNILTNGPIIANRSNDPFFKQRILGEIAFAHGIEPDFAKPLLKKFEHIDWSEFDQLNNPGCNSELARRSIVKSTTNIAIDYEDFDIFSNLSPITNEDIIRITKHLENLVEKCAQHGPVGCRNCLINNDTKYDNCMKYIFGHFIGKVGGHHHGHEVCDLFADIKLLTVPIAVCFHMKSGKLSSNNKDILFRQFYDSIIIEGIDAVSIVNNYECELSTKALLRFKRATRDSEKKWCIIFRNEMARILHNYYYDKYGSLP